MILCGVAWNLCFTSGTVLLTSCYEPVDSVRVQGVNDVILFGVAAVGSLASGYVYSGMGWQHLVFVVSGLMALASIALAISLCITKRKRTRTQRGDPDAPGAIEEPAYAPLAGESDAPPA